MNLSYDESRVGFARDPGRPAPYNVVGTPQTLLARAGGSVAPADAGFRFGPAPPGGIPAAGVATAYGSATVSFTWDQARGQYLLTTDGRPDLASDGRQVGASSVLVQSVLTTLSGNTDVNGVPTPVVQVVGSGPATVLRDGLAFAGTWTRPSAASPTSFLTGDGVPLTLAATPVWVLLVPAGQAVTLQ